MTREEAINRLNRIAEKAVHTPGETPFVMSIDDGIAVHMAVDALKGAKGDCISRQAAIDAIESHIRTAEEPYHLSRVEEVMNHVFEIAASCVYNLPSAQPEQRWIPVTERLPEENEVVLTQARFRDDIKMAVSARIDYNYWTGWGTREVNVVAWMPLPKVYKKEGETDDRLNQQGRR